MRNIYAKALADKLFKQRIVRARKGKGSYVRQPKHKKDQ
jgi:stalled ribosome alternative rescue factor ArfA